MVQKLQVEELKGVFCPYHKAAELIGDKWNLLIIKEFNEHKKPLRFNALLESLKPISSKTLSAKLKALVRYRIIEKEVINMSPVVTQYHLTKSGEEIMSILDSMAAWSKKWYG